MTTATSDIVLTVSRREELGKERVKKIRREGKVPAVVYGGGKEPIAITVDEKAVTDILKQETGENTIFLLKLEGTKQERRAMIREIQIDPVSRRITHVDFIRIVRGHKINVTVPVELTGDSVGVRHGGLLDFVSREVEIEVLPRELPDRVVVDISNLDVDQHITVGDLAGLLPKSARLLDDPHRVVVTIEAPRGAKGGGAGEGEEGEMEPARVITEQAEPEVIKKGKAEEAE